MNFVFCFPMFNIAAWNIRGLNDPLKQVEVKKLIFENHLDILGIVETRVRNINKEAIRRNVFRNWAFFANYDSHPLGRIWVGWNTATLTVNIVSHMDQVIHCEVVHNDSRIRAIISFIYGANDDYERRRLWGDLRFHSSSFSSLPWLLVGDFNALRSIQEHQGHDIRWNQSIQDFNDLVNDAELLELRFSGILFTWSNKRDREGCIARKLDRALGNDAWIHNMERTVVEFHPTGISDHTPVFIKFGNPPKKKNSPFKFFNFLAEREDFIPTVASIWSVYLQGSYQYRVCSKLRMLKIAFKVKSKEIGDLSSLVKEKKAALDHCQRKLDMNPLDSLTRQEEKALLAEYAQAARNEESFLKQKSRVLWLKEGDHNSAFFFKTMASRRNRKRILSLQTSNGSTVEGEEAVGNEAINFYKNLLGKTRCTIPTQERKSFFESLDLGKLSDLQGFHLVRDVESVEIKEVFFSFNDMKAPGPDGFNAHFFKKAWPIIGEEITEVVKEFFKHGKLLRELNSTILALVPKVPNPTTMGDFRPISCCNLLYKAISKIMANRVREILPQIISHNQTAFIPGRKIGDNIMLAQELLRNYHKNDGAPRCAIKVDIMKAFDSLDWGFLLDALEAFNFPEKLRKWIHSCITSPSFSININGGLVGYFPSCRGLRQGDPLSPYLFVIAMEILNAIMQQQACSNPQFKFHWRCKKLKLIQLSFADDLLLLCKGCFHSVKILKEAFDLFQKISELQTNPSKSEIFMTAIPQDTRL